MKYERLTIKRENGFATVRNTTLQGLIDRLAELEDKIERGELDYVADSKTEQTITDLLIEFDEMGFVPTTLCPDIEKYAIEWREKVRAEIKRLEIENAALRERLEKAVELPVKVGDTVWLVGYIHVSADAHLQCVEAKITDLMMMKDLVRYGAQEGDWCHEFTNDAIGEWVFITREAAEARLAEPNGGKNE